MAASAGATATGAPATTTTPPRLPALLMGLGLGACRRGRLVLARSGERIAPARGSLPR